MVKIIYKFNFEANHLIKPSAYYKIAFFFFFTNKWSNPGNLFSGLGSSSRQFASFRQLWWEQALLCHSGRDGRLRVSTGITIKGAIYIPIWRGSGRSTSLPHYINLHFKICKLLHNKWSTRHNILLSKTTPQVGG